MNGCSDMGAHPNSSTAANTSEEACRVPLDKNEGVVKRHLWCAVRKHRVIRRGRESKNVRQFHVTNHFAVVAPTIDSGLTSPMILLCGHPG